MNSTYLEAEAVVLGLEREGLIVMMAQEHPNNNRSGILSTRVRWVVGVGARNFGK
jgi:hypothetical protein